VLNVGFILSIAARAFSRVMPGGLLVRASVCCSHRVLIALDLPALDRPAHLRR
jgi:hypothetical protein